MNPLFMIKPGHVGALIISAITIVGVIIVIGKFHLRNKGKN